MSGEATGQESACERLERGGIIRYPRCPFPLPDDRARRFLLDERRWNYRRQDDVTYDPATGQMEGAGSLPSADGETLKIILCGFLEASADWLRDALPEYRARWVIDRVTFHPHEEATRHQSPEHRNDLLHVDAFPDRPTHGSRILRVLVNLNPTQDRVWLMSDPFARLLEKHGEKVGLPGHAGKWTSRLLHAIPRWLRAVSSTRSEHDEFMLRFSHFLKQCDAAQDRGAKQIWKFPPGSAWMAMTDAASHAVLRGRFALETSVLVPREVLVLPEEAPAAILAQACRASAPPRAA